MRDKAEMGTPFPQMMEFMATGAEETGKSPASQDRAAESIH